MSVMSQDLLVGIMRFTGYPDDHERFAEAGILRPSMPDPIIAHRSRDGCDRLYRPSDPILAWLSQNVPDNAYGYAFRPDMAWPLCVSFEHERDQLRFYLEFHHRTDEAYMIKMIGSDGWPDDWSEDDKKRYMSRRAERD